MSTVSELKEEIQQIEDAKALPENVRIVFEIATQVEKLQSALPRELIFRAAVQARFGRLEL